MGITSPTSTTGQILKDGTAVISFDANNNATFAGTVVSNTPLGMRNRIINGAMMIDQRNAGASVTPTDGQYTVDRWQVWCDAASKVTAQQSTTVPTGFKNSVVLTSTSAYSITSTQQFGFMQPIEGLNVYDLGWGAAGASSVTLSFWARSSLTGTFGGVIRNSAGDRFYVFSYTISSANTWEQKTVTITGDTSGTWLTTTGVGLYVYFSLGAGSSKVTTAGSWGATAYYGVTGQQNLVANNGATLYITGVQLEVGSTATPFERRIYGQELQLCQRYYESSFPIGVVPANGSTTSSMASGSQPVNTTDWLASFTAGTVSTYQAFVVPKRSSPTMTSYGTSAGKCIFIDFGTKATIYPGIVLHSATARGFQSYNDGVGLTNNSSWGFDIYNWVASSEL